VVVIIDWAASRNGDRGTPATERFSAEATAQTLENERQSVTHRAVRPETFLIKATALSPSSLSARPQNRPP